MIIVCNQCSKKFELEPSLIPDAGRLLQCSACDHQWFYKKKINVNQLSIEDSQEEKDINISPNDEKNIIYYFI